MRGNNYLTRGNNHQTRGNNNSSAMNRGGRRKCSFCESIFHGEYECPDKIYYGSGCDEDETSASEHDVILYQSNLLTQREFNVFVAESATSAILDCGASATVAGKVWFDSYYDGLSSENQKKVEFHDSNSVFKFGSGDKYKSLFKAVIPAKIGAKSIQITTDVVETAIPLLLSKEDMKNAESEINFINDSVKMFGEQQKVHLTKSGHYAIPLNEAKMILKNVEKRETKVNLIVQDDHEDKKKVAWKLHAQFGHPTKVKLLKLVEWAGRGDDKELLKEIDEVYDKCNICQEYSKPSPRPVVGLPHASRFNETVAMALKFFDGKIILHLIDHLTRFSSAIVVKSKEAKDIIEGVMKCWIAIFGPPEKILTENGDEFANKLFLELAETMNIRVMTTAAESPWSNGLVERHNATLAETLHKVLAEHPVNLDVALAWSIQAKNSLTNVHGFAPVQLAIGFTPQLPNVMSNKPPALEQRSSQDVITDHLNCMKSAREAFIKAESSERIKRALKHNVRPSKNNKFFAGDLVYFKRKDTRKWKGPGKVIGSDSSNVLIKHGSHYVRVHACRVMLDKNSNPQYRCAETSGCDGYNRNENQMSADSTDSSSESESLSDENSNHVEGLQERAYNQTENTVSTEFVENRQENEDVVEEDREESSNESNNLMNPKLKKDLNLKFKMRNEGVW